MVHSLQIQFLCNHEGDKRSEASASAEPSISTEFCASTELSNPHAAAPSNPHAAEPSLPTRTTTSLRIEISNSIHSKVRGLRSVVFWPFSRIRKKLRIPLTTAYTICQQPSTPIRIRMGRPRVLTTPVRERLITHATLSQEYQRKPLSQIASETGIIVNERTIRQAFADHGYQCRVARVKPFLSVKAKVKRLEWAQSVTDWVAEEYSKVIWTDESAFNVGGFAGNIWVTRLPQEEYLEACLLPKFRKLETVMVWGCIYRNMKGPLVFGDKKEWDATINGPNYCEYIVHPHLYTFWQERSRSVLDYVYLMQDGAPPHTAKFTAAVLQELGILDYFFAWPDRSPDCNPIENVWRIMKDRIGRRVPRSTTNSSLRIAIQEEWDMITSEEIVSLVDSMPERVAAVISANGGHTRY